MYGLWLLIWGQSMTILDTSFRSQFMKQPPPILPRGLILGSQRYKCSWGTSPHNPNKMQESNLIADPEVESQSSRSGSKKTHYVFSPQETERSSSEDTFPASARLDKHTCLRCCTKILNFSAVSRTSWLSEKLWVVSFQFAEFLLQNSLEALTVSGDTVKEGTWKEHKIAFKTHEWAPSAEPHGKSMMMSPLGTRLLPGAWASIPLEGIMQWWLLLQRLQLKFPRQYPYFKCACLNKI